MSHYAKTRNSKRVIRKLGFTYRFRGTEYVTALGTEKEIWYYSKKRGE